jgi:hypothetical protein
VSGRSKVPFYSITIVCAGEQDNYNNLQKSTPAKTNLRFAGYSQQRRCTPREPTREEVHASYTHD